MLEQIIAVVRRASRFMTRDFAVEQKGNDSNFVTSCDLAVQRCLAEELTALLPGSAFLGEENADCWDRTAEYVWVVDPIDGTSNFIRNIGFSAISVALCRAGEPYRAVVYNPYRDEMFSAAKGEGAFLNGQPIHVSERDFAHGHLCSAMSLYDKRYAPPCLAIIGEVYSQADDLRRMGTAAIEMAYLAAGRVELYFEIRLSPWDAAAASLLITEAGGCVEFLYHDGLPLEGVFPVIAANSRENFEKLREICCRHVPCLPY